MAQPTKDSCSTRMATVLTTVTDKLGSNNFIGTTSYASTFNASDTTQAAVLTPGFWYYNSAG
jgi:hypothetical protein